MIQEEIRTKNIGGSIKIDLLNKKFLEDMWSPKLKRDGKQSPFYNFV